MSNSNLTLKGVVEEIERLEEQKKSFTDQIKDVYGEAGNAGFDKKVLRKVIARRKKARAEVESEDEILSVYESQI